jgi:hypothetical protein
MRHQPTRALLLAGALATTLAATPGATAAADGCPSYDAGTKLGRVGDPTITEISGLVTSRRAPGVLWVHNDSGDDPRFYALDHSGTLLATITLTDGKHRDWEDMALGPGPADGVDYLYLGDIGDNKGKRDWIRVYRIAEPTVETGGGAGAGAAERAIDRFDSLRMTYPDGPHDAETLLVDPVDGTLYVITKNGMGPSWLYRYPPPLRPGEDVTLERLQQIPGTDVNQAWQTTPTGGDIAADGSRIVLRMYHQVWIWTRAPGQSLAEALAADPCPVSQREENQGESIALLPDGRSYLTISEGTRPPIWQFQLVPEE